MGSIATRDRSGAGPQWRAAWLEWFVFGAALLGAAAWRIAAPINHDIAWILQGAQRLLAGGRFGVDVVDVNPPLAWWIAMVPATLARVAAVPPAAAAAGFVVALAGVALAVTLWLLPCRPARPVARAALALAGIYLLVLVPGYDFGQREHLMVLFGLPYIALRASARRIAPGAATAIGVAAGLGFCLKPYFLLVPAGLEAWRWSRTRERLGWLAPETAALIVVGLAYAGAIVWLAPTYLSEVVPAARASYWAYESPAGAVALRLAWITAPGALSALAAVAAARPGTLPALAQALFVAGAMSLTSAALQMKGWNYHLVPIKLLFGFGACVACTGPARTAAAGLIRGLALGFVLLAALPGREPGRPAETAARLADALRRDAGPGGTVFGFIATPRIVHPAVLAAGVRWAAPYCCAYQLPGLVRAAELPPGRRDAARAAGRAETESMLTIVVDQKPAVLVVDQATVKAGFAGRPFDYLAWLRRDPRWVAALAAYRDGGHVAQFRLLVRRP